MPFELPSHLRYAFELRKTEELRKLREQLPPANQGRWWSLREFFSRSRTTEAIDVYFSQVTRSHLTLLLQGSHIPDPLAFDFSDYVSVVCRQAAESCGHSSVIRALSADKAWLVDLCRREMLREVERRRLDWQLAGCPTSAIWDEEEQEAIRAENAAMWERTFASRQEPEEPPSEPEPTLGVDQADSLPTPFQTKAERLDALKAFQEAHRIELRQQAAEKLLGGSGSPETSYKKLNDWVNGGRTALAKNRKSQRADRIEAALSPFLPAKRDAQ